MAPTQTNVRLAPMEQLREAIDTNDDWTGLTDAAERRKRQNRLHQRAWRRRKARQSIPVANGDDVWQSTNIAYEVPSRDAAPHASQPSIFPSQEDQRLYQRPSFDIDTAHRSMVAVGGTTPHFSLTSYSTNGSSNPFGPPSSTPLLQPLTPDMGSKRIPSIASIIFPLSPDHRLIALVQYNVFRAIMTNMAIMSYPAPESCRRSREVTLNPYPHAIPPSLQPTKLQCTVPHPEWMDLFPVAAMRDNLILHQEKIDEIQFCLDMMGVLFDVYTDLDMKCLLVWNDPWREDAWEVTEGFIRKYGFLMKGCEAMIDTTNKLRESRGELRLVVEVKLDMVF